MTRCWHLIWNSRQLWLFFTFVIFHQAAEDQCDKNTNVKSWAHWDNSVHVKILWKKDSESYNYCSINIGTKLNLYISVDHSVMLPQIVLEEKKKNISLFSTLCVLFPKEWLFGSSVNSLSRRDCGVFETCWANEKKTTLETMMNVWPKLFTQTPASRMCFHAWPLFLHICVL